MYRVQQGEWGYENITLKKYNVWMSPNPECHGMAKREMYNYISHIDSQRYIRSSTFKLFFTVGIREHLVFEINYGSNFTIIVILLNKEIHFELKIAAIALVIDFWLEKLIYITYKYDCLSTYMNIMKPSNI